MLRFSSGLAVSIFVMLVACSSSDETQTTPLASDGSQRAIGCGKATCKGDEFCCGGDGWADAACAPSCGEKNAMACDEASDCNTGEQCCFTLKDGNSIVTSYCAAVCPIQDTAGRLCKTATGDCPDGTCTDIGSVAPGGLSQCVLK